MPGSRYLLGDARYSSPCVTEYHFLLTFGPGSGPSAMSGVSLGTHSGPWRSQRGQRKLGHLYLFVSGYASLLMLPTPPTTQGKVTPSPLDPPSSLTPSFCVFALPSPPRCHRERPCSGPLLLSTGTPQKSQISLQFPVQCLFGGKRAGGRAALKKEPHSQTVWAALEGKHVQEGYARRAVRGTEARVFWS